MRLSGQVAIVTGGSQGLGLAYAKKLAQEGAKVIIADILDPRQKTMAWPDNLKQQIWFYKTDVQLMVEVERLVDFAVSTFKRIDILINNASIFSQLRRKPFYELNDEEWDRIFSVNVKGTFHCIKAVFPCMKHQNNGKIVNISSDAIFKGLPYLLHYVSSKGAIMAMTRVLARELAPYNITINAIAPGYTYHEDCQSWDEVRNETVIQLRSLQRTQTPEDLLGAIVFFASSESDFITGQTLVVDGGEVFH